MVSVSWRCYLLLLLILKVLCLNDRTDHTIIKLSSLTWIGDFTHLEGSSSAMLLVCLLQRRWSSQCQTHWRPLCLPSALLSPTPSEFMGRIYEPFMTHYNLPTKSREYQQIHAGPTNNPECTRVNLSSHFLFWKCMKATVWPQRSSLSEKCTQFPLVLDVVNQPRHV